ncbi:uncharacterized protein LOC113874322 [Abrus precatorius]|uniref:Uncharacterized protein LOC113874322 n=1 Tax=Abrus precatorius TaxID=3816 RepID=A0A8B8ML77_ABRPR|nr:uncharacterized protein LOC113874322 [Abrus precatorius]
MEVPLNSQRGHEQVNYMNNYQRYPTSSYSNNYNQGVRNHPNFSHGNQEAQRGSSSFNPPFGQSTQGQPSPLELALEKLTKHTSSFVQQNFDFMIETRTNLKNQDASIRNLEAQIGQLSKQTIETSMRPFSSNTIVNPKEDCKVITLKSGKDVDLGPKARRYEDELKRKEENVGEEKDNEEVVGEEVEDSPTLEKEKYEEVVKEGRQQKGKLIDEKSHWKKINKQLFEEYEKSQEIPSFINIPFSEALEKMPSYVKFMKELLSKKRRLQEDETMALTEECSAILQRKLPPKLKDLGNFSIPCTIGSMTIGKPLCDLGANTDQLNILMDMDEDAEVPLIRGRQFLATRRSFILRVQDENVTFNVFEAMKHLDDKGALLTH